MAEEESVIAITVNIKSNKSRMRIHHIGLYCVALEAMRSFFMRHFGCSSNEQYHNPRTGLRTYILTPNDGGCTIEIMSRPEVTAFRQEPYRSGYIHLSFSVGSKEAVDQITRELEDEGCACTSGPRTTGDGFYESQIVGPEGILIEVTV